jgi:predicted transcriptional regulator of viral defense system
VLCAVCYHVCIMSENTRHDAHIVPDTDAPDPDALYGIAEPRAGYFTTSQAAKAGYSRSLLAHHVRSGMLDRVGHGIYRLRRYPESPRADLVVAGLRVEPEGVVSHESALELYGLSDVLPSEIHVTVPRTASRRRPGIALHTSRLDPLDVASRDGVKVTTVERTIADVARSGLPEQFVLQAIDEAIERGLTTPALLARHVSGRGGRAKRLVDLALDETRS